MSSSTKQVVETTAGDYPNGNPGGFIKAPSRPRMQKIKWTAENDRKLLLFMMERQVSGREMAKIADVFPEQPTPKAIQERLAKLRKERDATIKEAGIVLGGVDASAAGQDEVLDEQDEDEEETAQLQTSDGELTGWDLAREGIPLEILEAARRELDRPSSKEDREAISAANALLQMTTDAAAGEERMEVEEE